MIEAEDAFGRMGADVMRWQYCAQPPNQNLLFGFGPGHEIKRKLLTLWNSVGFLVRYANIEAWRPAYGDLAAGPSGEELRPLDRWLVARTGKLVEEATEAYDSFLTVNVMRAFESFVDDLSNWYIRRSRRRFYGDDPAAFATLWYALVQSLRVVAPVMPFLADHLWRNLVAGPCADAPRSIHLAGWPNAAGADEALLAEVAEVRRVVELGRQARGGSGLSLRQPLRRLVVEGATLAVAHADEISEELRVKEIEFGAVESELRVKPHLPALGPRLGKELAAVRTALAAGDFEALPDGGFRAAGHDLAADEVLVERTGREGWAVASEEGLTVAVETTLDAELVREGRVYDLIHAVNSLRKEQGLELTDRIRLTIPQRDADLLDFSERIAAEVLAVSVEADGSDDLAVVKA